MNNRDEIINRLHELRREHEASVGEGRGEAPGFIQDEQSTRKSYQLVLEDALDARVLSPEDLEREGLPDQLT